MLFTCTRLMQVVCSFHSLWFMKTPVNFTLKKVWKHISVSLLLLLFVCVVSRHRCSKVVIALVFNDEGWWFNSDKSRPAVEIVPDSCCWSEGMKCGPDMILITSPSSMMTDLRKYVYRHHVSYISQCHNTQPPLLLYCFSMTLMNLHWSVHLNVIFFFFSFWSNGL